VLIDVVQETHFDAAGIQIDGQKQFQSTEPMQGYFERYTAEGRAMESKPICNTQHVLTECISRNAFEYIVRRLAVLK
jgi:hypothetical protein